MGSKWNAQFLVKHSEERLRKNNCGMRSVCSRFSFRIGKSGSERQLSCQPHHQNIALSFVRIVSFVDKGIWDTDKGILLELPVSVARMRYAEMVARLPMRMGGFGLSWQSDVLMPRVGRQQEFWR